MTSPGPERDAAVAQRCKRCNKKPRGKLAERNAEYYKPFCSYQCQQWNNVEEVQEHLAALRAVRAEQEAK